MCQGDEPLTPPWKKNKEETLEAVTEECCTKEGKEDTLEGVTEECCTKEGKEDPLEAVTR